MNFPFVIRLWFSSVSDLIIQTARGECLPQKETPLTVTEWNTQAWHVFYPLQPSWSQFLVLSRKKKAGHKNENVLSIVEDFWSNSNLFEVNCGRNWNELLRVGRHTVGRGLPGNVSLLLLVLMLIRCYCCFDRYLFSFLNVFVSALLIKFEIFKQDWWVKMLFFCVHSRHECSSSYYTEKRKMFELTFLC